MSLYNTSNQTYGGQAPTVHEMPVSGRHHACAHTSHSHISYSHPFIHTLHPTHSIHHISSHLCTPPLQLTYIKLTHSHTTLTLNHSLIYTYLHTHVCILLLPHIMLIDSHSLTDTLTIHTPIYSPIHSHVLTFIPLHILIHSLTHILTYTRRHLLKPLRRVGRSVP